MRSTVTIVTPGPIALVTLEVAKAELGIDEGDTSSDAALQRAIDQVSQGAATYCKRVFQQETVTERIRLEGSRPRQLRLSRYPVTPAPADLVITADGLAVDAENYDVDFPSGLVYPLPDGAGPFIFSGLYWCGRVIDVAYTGGYAPDAIPADLQRAALLWIKAIWYGKGRDPGVRVEEVPDVLRLEYRAPSAGASSEAGPAEALSLLDPYRHIAL